MIIVSFYHESLRMFAINSRTKQEETRASMRNLNSTNARNISNVNLFDHFDSSVQMHSDEIMQRRSQNVSFHLSTETCIYIHGVLIASVFVIGLMR